MGPAAEPPLIDMLRHPDSDMRKKACEILKFVGGEATLKAMAKIPPDPDVFVRRTAQDAIVMIKLRVGKGASEEDEKKEPAPRTVKGSRKKS